MKSPADVRRATIESSCRPWLVRASALVASAVADARAHGGSAITKALVSTKDGRATAARASRNRSLAAAERRFGELAEAMAGPSTRSLDGLIRDAWAEQFSTSRAYWFDWIGPKSCLPWREATASQVATVRGLILGGYDARDRITNVTGPAYRRLKAIVVAGASPSRSERDRSGSLRVWEVATVKAVALAASNAILTGSFRADVLAGRSVIRPELLHHDPTV